MHETRTYLPAPSPPQLYKLQHYSCFPDSTAFAETVYMMSLDIIKIGHNSLAQNPLTGGSEPGGYVREVFVRQS